MEDAGEVDVVEDAEVVMVAVGETPIELYRVASQAAWRLNISIASDEISSRDSEE